MNIDPNLASMPLEELIAYRDKIKFENDSLKSEITQLEEIIQNTSRDNERQEEQIMNSYQEKIFKLRNENAEQSQKIHNDEDNALKALDRKVDKVIKEKEQLEARLKADESSIINKLQSEIEKEKANEIMLESQIAEDMTPVDFDDLSPELNDEYQQIQETKNEKVLELMSLCQQIERIITNNNFISHKISSTQMELTEKKNSIEFPAMPEYRVNFNVKGAPTSQRVQTNINIPNLRRFSVSASIRRKKRRLSHK